MAQIKQGEGGVVIQCWDAPCDFEVRRYSPEGDEIDMAKRHVDETDHEQVMVELTYMVGPDNPAQTE